MRSREAERDGQRRYTEESQHWQIEKTRWGNKQVKKDKETDGVNGRTREKASDTGEIVKEARKDRSREQRRQIDMTPKKE